MNRGDGYREVQEQRLVSNHGGTFRNLASFLFNQLSQLIPPLLFIRLFVVCLVVCF